MIFTLVFTPESPALAPTIADTLHEAAVVWRWVTSSVGMRRFRGSLSKVLVSDDVLGVEEPTWREVHPGVTVPWVDDEAVAVWARPYPGHPGGFVAQNRPQQIIDRNARALSDLFDLFDCEVIAWHAIDGPYVEALPYLVRVVDLATRVLVQRLPGELEDYLEHPDDAGRPRLKPRGPSRRGKG